MKYMRKSYFIDLSKTNLTYFIFLFSGVLHSQIMNNQNNSNQDFWRNVQFGGGFGLNISSQFTEVNISPGAIYRFNPKVAAGIGIQGSYVSSRDSFSSAIYGIGLISLLNPLEEFQISIELEQLRVNRTLVSTGGPDMTNNFWNTGLFLGGGYSSDNIVFGLRYNLLFKKTDYVYTDAMMPFIRVYF